MIQPTPARREPATGRLACRASGANHPRPTVLALALVICLGTMFVAGDARGEAVHRRRLREALECERRGEFGAAVAALSAAVQHRPDYPRLHWKLACLHARLGREAETLAALESLAALGVSMDPKSDPVLGAMAERPAFLAVTRRLAANAEPRGHCIRDSDAERTQVDGIIESVAWIAARGEWYLGDVRRRAVLRVRPGAERPQPVDAGAIELGGVFALRCSSDGRTLWAASSRMKEPPATPEGRPPGFTGLVAFDLAGTAPPQAFPISDDADGHLLGDFAQSEDGTLYASDSRSPCLWRLEPGSTTLAPWIRHEEFVSLQGVVLSPDGRSLLVADYGSGLWRINIADRKVTPVAAPPGVTLFGVDGLYRHGADVIAVQNGIRPARILRLSLDRPGLPDQMTVIASGLKAFEDLALGEVRDGRFWVVGDSGWEKLEGKREVSPRPLSLLSVQLSPP